MKKIIAVLGDGAWGTAIAQLLARNGYQVILWCYNKEVAREIDKFRTNTRYVGPEIKLHANITPVIDINDAISRVDIVCQAIPVAYLREVLLSVSCDVSPAIWISLSKGVEQKSCATPTQIIRDSICTLTEVAVVAGPSFAREVLRQQPTALMLAADSEVIAKQLALFFANDFFAIHPTTDVIGVEWTAALKNVIALGVGFLQGSDCGENIIAAFLTHAFAQMQVFIAKKGGRTETVFGLAGLGDIILTCMSSQSKNVAYGRSIAKRLTVEQEGLWCEGINTLNSITTDIQYENNLFKSLHDAINQKISVETFINFILRQ